MQLRGDALGALLRRQSAPIVWIHGDEPLLCLEAADAVRNDARSRGMQERVVLDVDRSFRLDHLREQASALSLFATRRLIELRFANKPGKEIGGGVAELAPLFSDDTQLLVNSPRLDRATLESAWFRELERHAVVVAIVAIERDGLERWIAQRLAAQQQRADPATLALIAQRVEGNLLAAHQEISKLGLLFGPGELPADEVADVVFQVSRHNAFALTDAVISGDVARTLRCLEGLRAEGEAEPLVLWSLTDTIRSLLRLAQWRDAGQPVASRMRELRIWPPRDRLFQRALDRLQRAPLESFLQRAATIDRIIKGIESGDAWEAMIALACEVAGARLPIAPNC